MSVDENWAPSHRQSSQYFDYQIPPSASMPSLAGTGMPYDMSMPPPPPPPRRTSMQDASNDILRTTYPIGLQVPNQETTVRQPSPRLFSPARMRRDKGKGRAPDVYHPPPPGGEVVGNCRWDPGLGYVCEMCSRITVDPSKHRTNMDGTGCVDFSGHSAPLSQDVRQAVASDPEQAVAQAEMAREGMAAMQAGGQQWMPPPGHQWAPPNYGPEFQGAPQHWGSVSGPASGFARPGGSIAVPTFTTASQMQQWGGHMGWDGQQQPGQGQQGQGPGSMGYGAGPGMFS